MDKSRGTQVVFIRIFHRRDTAAAYEAKTLKILSARKSFLYFFIANAPDLDFIPSICSICCITELAIVWVLRVLFYIVAAFFMSRSESHYAKSFLICLSSYCSHLSLDCISKDGKPPFEVPTVWPLSNEYFIFPLLTPITHSSLNNATISQFLMT